MDKEEIKDSNRLELALDHETRQMIAYIAYNWDVAAGRMEKISKERVRVQSWVCENPIL